MLMSLKGQGNTPAFRKAKAKLICFRHGFPLLAKIRKLADALPRLRQALLCSRNATLSCTC
jgi:hypothetical protein